jgi:hypothetical protein
MAGRAAVSLGTTLALALLACRRELSGQPGRWIGTKAGVFALALDSTPSAGHAEFEYFRFSAP